MQRKKACLVVDLRDGKNLVQIPDLVAVLAAAGWKTDVTLKAYGGETMNLAAQAAKKGYDVIIAYGGDGTLNQVVNGVMSAGGKSVVGDIPGGTANEWAGEIGIPLEHAKAALTLVDSGVRKVDLGHVRVQGLDFPSQAQQRQPVLPSNGKKTQKKQAKTDSKTQQHFLLMAGIGNDASVLSHLSKSLKYRVGELSFAITALKELPGLHPFPVEIWEANDGGEEYLLWRGEAWEVLVANARRYGNAVDIAPRARIDDGKLDVCVFTATNALRSVEQIASLLARHKPDEVSTEHFQGAHFTIRVPASMGMHLDGSIVELKDYLSKSDRDALEHSGEGEQVMVTYHFDAEPHALGIAIPRTYDDTLLENPPGQNVSSHMASSQQGSDTAAQQQHASSEGMQEVLSHYRDAIQEQGSEVTVIGVAPNPEQKDVYIIAGTTKHKKTGDPEPVAVRVNGKTTLTGRTGEQAPPATLQELQEGAQIVVVGKKSKRGVIRATHVLVPT